MDDLDFIDLISTVEYDEEWDKVKKPIHRKVKRYYLIHEMGLKGLFLSAAGAVLLLQYTPYSYLLTFPQWLARFVTSMLLPALGL
ncbi:hypothetical protein [Coprothermobacter platensis]|uniref:hypothetical protein n=1 Tax=Coprothermobacter platensis TaxID=108819 RepID=UPI0003806446|nr:hypothetical protein [Coprothermobacter platensis]